MAMPHRKEEDAIATEAADFASLVAENASLRDRYLRALAETANIRRRGERIAEEARDYAITEFSRDLLQIVDNQERAVAAAEDTDSSRKSAALLDGVRATGRMLAAMLERFGIRKIEAHGAPFDPALHEAVVVIEEPECEPATIADVLQEGYTIKDRLLRPARVAVVKRPLAQEVSQE